jgi:hypothetical protein
MLRAAMERMERTGGDWENVPAISRAPLLIMAHAIRRLIDGKRE